MGILAGRAKNEFSYLLGKSTAQMKRRHEMLAELQTYPKVTKDYEEGVQQVLVNDEWFDFLLAKWNKFGDLATDEIAGIDAMLQLIADERRLMVPKQLAEAFQI